MRYTAVDHTFMVCAYKASEFLEDCVRSLLDQTVKSRIAIATSTPNGHISAIAEKYGLTVFVNEGKSGIGGDWNFAYRTCQTPLLTIAHQDDLYEAAYLERILDGLNGREDPIIAFSGYAELRDGEKVFDNKLLKIKRLMLAPLKKAPNSRFIRRRVLSLGCPICCPAVTYVRDKVGDEPFSYAFSSNLDWDQWEKLSRKKGAFVYVPAPLMCHRIHEGSTTSEIIGENKRTVEDRMIFERFWPRPIAALIARVYAGSEKSNDI